MSMDYISTGERNQLVLDLPRFAADLAKELGGKVLASDSPHDRYTRVLVGDVELTLSAGFRRGETDKVTVSVWPASQALRHVDVPRGDGFELPSATVSATRPLHRVVADIRRRVIEPSKAPIAKRLDRFNEQKRRASDLVRTADRLRKRFPGLSIKTDLDRGQSGSVYYNNGGVYFNGRLNADGSVYPDRLGTLTAEQFERVMKALWKDPTKDA